MGPRQRCRGIPGEIFALVNPATLQWGRGSAAAELQMWSAPAFPAVGLQWGRGSAAAEFEGARLHCRQYPRFNGAAAALPRNCGVLVIDCESTDGFNGAAAALPRN